MTSTAPKIAFHAAESKEAQAALKALQNRYANVSIDEADIVVTLGGDGTLLESLHEKSKQTLPVYGMNCGSVGFLLNPYRPDHLMKYLQTAHHVDIYPLKMTAYDSAGKKYEAIAFNEVSLLRQTRQAAKLKITIDGIERIEELVCDGILLATPAGSTAYNLSAHGPILPLSANVLALTPISAFRPRRWRGALIPFESKVTIEILQGDKRPVSATADYTEVRNVQSLEIILSKTAKRTLLFDADHPLEERITKEQFEV